MNRRKEYFWMIRPKGFVGLLGAEYELMRNAGGNVLIKFYISSMLIFLISIISFLSIRYAIELLFHVVVVEIALSLFLSLLFVLMYIFLINTFSKDAKGKSVFSFSNVTRTGFVIFMGFIISKPVEIYVYKNRIVDDVSNYQEQLGQAHAKKINLLFDNDREKLRLQKNHYEQMNSTRSFDKDIAAVTMRLDSLDKKEQELVEVSNERIRRGAFFTYRLKKVANDYPLSHVICLGMILLFLLPGYLVYSISKGEEYFKMKTEIERTMIAKAYNAFCLKYTAFFKAFGKENIQFYSKYEDPPFNTILKRGPQYQASTDFHNKYAANSDGLQ